MERRLDGPILEIDRVSKLFGDFIAIDDVSMAVRRGEFLTLLGPSGCGKTTLLRMIAGFETPTSGQISIAQKPMANIPPYGRPIGFVFQNLALFPHLSVGENVAFGLRVRRIGREEASRRVGDALNLVELPGFEDRPIHELSGGQKQRVALARALVIRPDVLLLDEPLGALDLKLRRQLQQELKRIQQRVGTTFVFVTHDQEEALTMSDRIAVMNRGRVEQLDTPEAVYQRPRSPFVAQFVGDTNFLSGTVAACQGNSATVHLEHLGVDVIAVSDRPLRPSESVALCLRPEHLFIDAQAARHDYRLQGRISERIYIGATSRFSVQVGSATLIAVRANTDLSEQLAVGQEVALGWSAEHAVMIDTSAGRGALDAPSNHRSALSPKSTQSCAAD